MNIVRALRFAITVFIRFCRPFLFVGVVLLLLKQFQKLKNAQHVEDKPKTENPPNPPLIVTAEHRPENEEKPEETWKNLQMWGKFERVFRVVEFIVLIGGIAFVFFQGRQIQKSTDAAVAQAQVSQRQLDEMRRTRILDERAWITVIEITNELVSTNPLDMRITVFDKNTGKTPALHTHSCIGMTTDTNLIPKVDTYWNPHTDQMVAPDVTTDSGSIGIDKTTPRDIIGDLIAGKSLYVFGTTWYDDIFGNHHWSQWCFYMPADLLRKDRVLFRPAPFHNECDDEEADGTR